MIFENKGFTLIELSIVLVIIGLVVGGVLIGKDLIEAAQIRTQVSQFESLDAATMTFKTKYHCLPGDCPNGGNFGFVVYQYDGCSNPGSNSGNGNGIIGTTTDVTLWAPAQAENLRFWDHLADAGWTTLRPFACNRYGGSVGVSGRMPRSQVIVMYNSPYSGGGSAGGGMQGHHYMLASLNITCAASGSAAVDELLTPLKAFMVDSKTDDGLPATGRTVASSGCNVLMLNSPYGAGGGTISPAEDCVVMSGGQYVYNSVANTSAQNCTLNVKTSGF